MANRQLPLPSPIVKKSNALARARWNAESVWEPRLVALLASKVRVDDTDFQIYEIPITELIRNSEKIPSGRTYLEISKVVDHLMGRVLTIKDEIGNGWTKYNIFSRCHYNPGKGILEVRFDPDLKPHYINLQKNFAKYNLMEFLLLPSIYSQRLFEILKSWDDAHEVTLTVNELHDMLDCPNSFRNNFKNFRLRVLEKAHKDITEHTSLRYEWEPIKKGRSVESIRFVFSKGKIEIKQQEKKEIAQEDQSQKSNRLFLKAMSCAKQKQGNCIEDTQKKSVCEICRRFGIMTEIRNEFRASSDAVSVGSLLSLLPQKKD